MSQQIARHDAKPSPSPTHPTTVSALEPVWVTTASGHVAAGRPNGTARALPDSVARERVSSPS
jgi:hypothetical protein